MRLLIIGGTRFLGRHLVEAALARGHQVTIFNRGKTNPHLFPQIEKLRGDRDGRLFALEGRTWDAIIDTCGYIPRVVNQTVELFAKKVDNYTFISSISVYAYPSQRGMDETAQLGRLKDESVEAITDETYGPLKALCERVVEGTFREKALIIRPGLIVGPHDPTNRFTYWPVRMARGGEVLAPGDRDRQVQFIDGRDLADWILKLIQNGSFGYFNATGPSFPLTMAAFLQACQQAVESESWLTWVSERFLLEQGVKPFTELPLWLPEKENGLMTVDLWKALALGLEFRSIRETILDTLAWHRSRNGNRLLGAGLNPEKEAQILKTWRMKTKG
jgi:2'-hydroxyisoflavone reductase